MIICQGLIIAGMAANLSGIEPRGSKPKAYFTVDEAAEMAGLAVSSLKTYAGSNRTDLIRGRDFYVHRRGVRRRLYFTKQGLERLISRSYSVFADPVVPNRARTLERYRLSDYGAPYRYEGQSLQEKRQRLRQQIFFAMLKYRETPCAVPNCPCMIHRLGVPQAAEVYEVFPPGGRKK